MKSFTAGKRPIFSIRFHSTEEKSNVGLLVFVWTRRAMPDDHQRSEFSPTHQRTPMHSEWATTLADFPCHASWQLPILNQILVRLETTVIPLETTENRGHLFNFAWGSLSKSRLLADKNAVCSPQIMHKRSCSMNEPTRLAADVVRKAPPESTTTPANLDLPNRKTRGWPIENVPQQGRRQALGQRSGHHRSRDNLAGLHADGFTSLPRTSSIPSPLIPCPYTRCRYDM